MFELCSKDARLLHGPDGSESLLIPVPAKDAPAARMLFDSASGDKKGLTVRVTQGTSRTEKQNALVWALCTAIAKHDGGEAGNVAPEDVYGGMLAKYGQRDTLLVPEEAVERLKTVFRSVKTVGARRVNGRGMKAVDCLYGSSHYDKKQIGALIAGLLKEAGRRGIETEYKRGSAYEEDL